MDHDGRSVCGAWGLSMEQVIILIELRIIDVCLAAWHTLLAAYILHPGVATVNRSADEIVLKMPPRPECCATAQCIICTEGKPRILSLRFCTCTA